MKVEIEEVEKILEISSALKDVFSTKRIDVILDSLFSAIGELFEAERVSCFRYFMMDEVLMLTHEWTRKDIPAQIGKGIIRVSALPFLQHRIKTGGCKEMFCFPPAKEFTPDRIVLEKELEEITVFPLIWESVLMGFLCLDTQNNDELFDFADRIQEIAGNVCQMMLRSKKTEVKK